MACIFAHLPPRTPQPFTPNPSQVLRDLKFGIGDGSLHFYLYNWRLEQKLTPREVGLILM